jgi:hypothetical protein
MQPEIFSDDQGEGLLKVFLCAISEFSGINAIRAQAIAVAKRRLMLIIEK